MVENLLVKVGGIKCFMTFMIINIDEYNLLMGLDFLMKIGAVVGCWERSYPNQKQSWARCPSFTSKYHWCSFFYEWWWIQNYNNAHFYYVWRKWKWEWKRNGCGFWWLGRMQMVGVLLQDQQKRIQETFEEEEDDF